RGSRGGGRLRRRCCRLIRRSDCLYGRFQYCFRLSLPLLRRRQRFLRELDRPLGRRDAVLRLVAGLGFRLERGVGVGLLLFQCFVVRLTFEFFGSRIDRLLSRHDLRLGFSQRLVGDRLLFVGLLQRLVAARDVLVGFLQGRIGQSLLVLGDGLTVGRLD